MEFEISLRLNSMINLVFLLFFTFAINSSASDYTIIAQEVCKASRDPPACVASISSVPPPNATLLGAIISALRVSSHNLDVGREMVQQILDSSATNFNRSNAAKRCLEGLRYSEYRTNSVSGALLDGAIKDARSWMSAALGYQYGCWSGLKYVNDTAEVGKTMSFFNSELIVSTANALAMMVNYDIFGDKTSLWGTPKTERDGFWEPTSKPSDSCFFGSVVPIVPNPNVTVCKTGDCNYLTVQEAVNSVPDNLPANSRFTIWIKAGVYEEMVRVPYEKKYVIFYGDGVGKTVVTGSMSVSQPGVTTYDTATVGVVGDGFMARDLTIQNTAGPESNQAVAFRSSSDLSVIENCEFIGNQDTLYAHSLRQYYKSCRIQGNVDFIFGNAAALFENCIILISPRQVTTPEKGETNAITAQGRIGPAQSTGFVFHNCLINGTDSYMSLYLSKPGDHNNYLGRPWKEYSRTVFIRCTLEVLIRPEGWLPWSGDFALGTLYYGEFENVGRGSNSSQRVRWSRQIPAEHVAFYSLQNFIQGDRWMPLME